MLPKLVSAGAKAHLGNDRRGMNVYTIRVKGADPCSDACKKSVEEGGDPIE